MRVWARGWGAAGAEVGVSAVEEVALCRSEQREKVASRVRESQGEEFTGNALRG